MKLPTINGAIYSVNAAALLLGAAGLLSRILGILRDRLLAAQFGAGRELDVYYASFQIPDFMSVLFLLGAGSAAILPVFQEYLARNEEEARRLISALAGIFFAGAIGIAIFVWFLTPLLVGIIAPGFLAEERALTATLTKIMLFSPILLGLSSIFSAVIQSFQRFWAYALAPIFYNIGIIIGIFVLVPLLGIEGLAVGVVLGALLHFLIQFLTVRQLGFVPKLVWDMPQTKFWAFDSGIREVLRLAFPRALSVSFTNLTILALVAIGSTLASGSIAVFQFAQNLYFVPIGIFGVSYAVVLFPRMSRAYIGRDAGAFFQELFLGIRSILFWIAPSLVLFIVLRAHIVRLALGAGEFSWEDTRLTAAVLALLSFSMFANALAALFIKGFYALENTWRPLAINMGASALSVALALFFTEALSVPSDFTKFFASSLRVSDLADVRVLGLALGFSIGFAVNISLLYGALMRLAVQRFQQAAPFPWSDIFKIVFASLLAGAAAYFVRVSFSETAPLITFLRVLWQGTVAGAAGLFIYFGALFILKEESALSLWRTARRQFFRVGALPPSWDGETHLHQHRL